MTERDARGRFPKGSGNPAAGNAPSGPGWGGPAQGASSFEYSHRPPLGQMKPETIQAKMEKKIASATEALAAISEIMRSGQHEANKLNAAYKVIEIYRSLGINPETGEHVGDTGPQLIDPDEDL